MKSAHFLARRMIAPILAAGFTCVSAWAQYPTKPITLVVGFPAGGSTDLVARLFADPAKGAMGQPLVVENKAGANSIIATEAVASSPAEGYTLLVAAQNHAITPALYADRIKFDAVKSFTPICIIAESPEVLVVTPKMGVKTLSDFMKKVREKPGDTRTRTVGTGSGARREASAGTPRFNSDW